MTGVSTTVALMDSRRSLPSFLLLLLTISAFTIIPVKVEAQYRGGRKPPEKALKRTGLLFVEAGLYRASPGRDFSSASRGAASIGSGWKVSVGSWIGGGFTGELEWGVIDNDRFSSTNPWYFREFSNVTGMDFHNSYLLPLLRINFLTDRKVIPYVLGGMGRVHSRFTVHYTMGGNTYREAKSVKSPVISLGVGVNLVVADHATVVVEFRSYDWFNNGLIPGLEYWTVSRLGLGLSWHF